MEREDAASQKEERAVLPCHICGDKARGMNFNAISCMSCKMFFRRHALRHRNTLRCARDSHCNITVKSRSTCVACRLKKCHTVGMKPELIRAYTEHYLPMPQPLSLLHKDRSTLSSEQWNLLSNIIHACDEENPLIRMKSLFDSESSLPMKMRVKEAFVVRFIEQSMMTIEPIIKRSPDFQALAVDARRILIRRNLFWIALYQRFILSHQLDFLNDSKFILSVIGLYGVESFKKVMKVYQQADANETIHKVMLFITTFFSNSSMVLFDSTHDTSSATISMNLVRIQDFYVTMLWKYLLYQYGFKEAVRRYSSVITTMLDSYRILENIIGLKSYDDMFTTTVKQMERSLVIEE